MRNRFGEAFAVELFGASHAPSVGVVVTGCPAGIPISPSDFEGDMKRRRPGQSLSTQRMEADAVRIEEGVKDGETTGEPVKLAIANTDVRSEDYAGFKRKPRPGHADFTALGKYGEGVDLRGGGIFSGRMTAPLVAAGVLAKKIIRGMDVKARLVRVGNATTAFGEELRKAQSEGDSVGGCVECVVEGVPQGLGEPFFDSAESVLSHGIFSIPGVKGVEFGSGFACVGMRGSEHNDEFLVEGGEVRTKTNNAGGILGGITDGMPVVFRVAFKPTASIARKQKTVDLEALQSAELEVKGRHDPCIALRAVPVVEAVAAIVLADLMLMQEKRCEHGIE